MPFHKGTPPRQRGALGILGGLVLFLSVLFTALAVDTGRLMLEHRRLQLVADMAALDASSQSGGCGDGTLALAEAAAQTSAARNNHSIADARTLDVLLGNVSVGTGGIRNFAQADPESSMSVQVTAGNTVPASLFAGGLLGREATLQATAVAERQVLAGFSVGSLLVSLNDDDAGLLNNLLGGVLGSSVSLDAVAYRGIAATNVKLLDLVDAAAYAGTVQELLIADVSASELLQVYADAVNASGVADAGVSAAMNTLIAASVSDLALTLGEVLNVTTAPTNVEEAASVGVNLLDLITTTALVANGESAIILPLNTGIPGLITVNTELMVIEPPQIAIGPPGKNEDGDWRTKAKTAQVRLKTDVSASVNVPLLQLSVDLGLHVQIAQGEAWLDSIQCRNAIDSTSVVSIGAQPGIANVFVTISDYDGPPIAAPPANIGVVVDLGLLGNVSVANVTAGLNLPLEPDEGDLTFYVDVNDPNALPMMQRLSSDTGGRLNNGFAELDKGLVVNVNMLGGLGGLVLNGLSALGINANYILSIVLSSLLQPLLAGLGISVLDPLLRLLGIEVGAIDVQLIDLDLGRPNLLI
jgi:uncharacterized membrane protein